MVKRIALPSADVLFGNGNGAPEPQRLSKPADAGPRRSSAARKSTPKSTPATSSSKAPKKAAPKAGAAKPRARKASSEVRLSAVESRLESLPVDALIDLRDGIGELLAGDVVDEAAVVRLLDSVES